MSISDEQKEYRKEHHKKYRQTDKGKATEKRYAQSPKNKVYKKNYRQTKAYKISKKRYRQSEKGKAHELKDKAKRRVKLIQTELISPIEIFYRDKGICQLCKELTDWNSWNLYPTLDHILPLSKGGQHIKDNIQLAHRICNQLKHNNQDKLITWEEWLKYKLDSNRRMGWEMNP